MLNIKRRLNNFTASFRITSKIILTNIKFFIIKVFFPLIELLNFLFSKSFNLKLKNFYFNTYYLYHFYKLEILEAYKIRIKHINTIIELTHSPFIRKGAIDYINTIWFSNLEEILNSNELSAGFANNDFKSPFVLNKKSKNFKLIDSNKNIIIIGPLFDFSKFNLNDYEIIISNKPIPSKYARSFKGTIFLVTGPTWPKYHRREIDKLTKSNMLKIYSTKECFPKVHCHPALADFPRYPLGTLMNLQRTLYFTLHAFEDCNFNVCGYSLYQTYEIQSAWYKENSLNLVPSHIYTLANHDYLLSLSFTKKFFEFNANYIGDTVEICKKEVGYLLENFIENQKNFK